MALTKGLISKKLATFIKNQNKSKVESPDDAIDKYCEELETEIAYAPDGEGYQKAKEEFEALIKNEK